MKNFETLLTAPQVARHCSADLKTIHNWVNAGQIRFFRTPGRHLRFRPEDVAEFLEHYGYPVPRELRKFARQVIMIIDPDDRTSEDLQSTLEVKHIIKKYDCPVQALLSINREQPDLIVSELELPGLDGSHMIERLCKGATKAKKKNCPVVIYTNDEGGQDECKKFGVSVLIKKPNPQELGKKVGQLLTDS